MIAKAGRLSFDSQMIQRAALLARQGSDSSPDTISGLAQRYLIHIEQQNHCPSNIRKAQAATQRLDAVAGNHPPDAMDVATLETVRQLCVIGQLSRGVCNQYTRIIIRMFRWGHTRGYCSEHTAARLTLLEPLKRGRTKAHDNAPRRPVPTRILKATLRGIKDDMRRAGTPGAKRRFLRLWTMIAFQLRTGCRPGEACSATWDQVEAAGDIWTYRPTQHKSAHLGIEREIFVGPRMQRMLANWTNRRTGSVFGCSLDSYRDQLYRTLDKHKLPRFHPHQLRHGFATWIDRAGDEKAAQVLLGHEWLKTTRGYIDPNKQRAMELLARLG